MFDLTFLGTSASVPSAERNHPGLLVEAGSNRILGIPGLFSTLRLQQSADVVRIHGGPDTLDVVVRMLAGLWGAGRAPIPLEIVPLAEGRVTDAGEFTIGCFPVRHRDTDSFGFSFESQARRHLQPERLSALGVPDGPVRKALADGRPVTLEDGRRIDPEDVLGAPEKRKKLVVVGDTETTEELSEHVRDADVLVIEATFLDRDSAMARDYGHVTATKAAELAAASNVKQLVLTHISGRYPDEEIVAEAMRIFPNSRVAADLDHIVI
jgi:ribonuclease Z